MSRYILHCDLHNVSNILPFVKKKKERKKIFCQFSIFDERLGAAETWCLKVKTVAKLNSTEMDFWRRLARISMKDKIRNNIIKQKMNVTRSLLEDIKTKQLKWYGHVQRMEEERLPKCYEMEPTRKKKAR